MASVEPTSSYVRYRVIFVCMLMAVLLYLDRFCISFAEVFIKDELGLSDEQIGILLGSFFVSYALCQVPSGWFSDRFGARKMLTIYILMWSLFTAMTGLATGFIIGQMMNGGYRGGGPLYRDRQGQFSNGYGGGYLSRDYRTGQTVTNAREHTPAARQAPSRVQSRTAVVSRGGFGGGGRGYGG